MIKYSWILFIVVLISVFQLLNSTSSKQLEIVFLDVGQGDSMLIKTPNGSIGLIDVGVNDAVIVPLSKELDFLETKIDFVVLTHPDSDHIEGLIELVDRYEINTIFINETNKQNSLVEEIKDIIASNNIRNYNLKHLNDFRIDGVEFDVLWPNLNDDIFDINNPNNTSIALHISYANFDLVTLGDLEAREEIKATTNFASEIDILKISHHGSNTSTSQLLIDMLKPSPCHAIISAGKDNQFGHPTREIINLLRLNQIGIHRTDIKGNIKVIVDHNGKYDIKFSHSF